MHDPELLLCLFLLFTIVWLTSVLNMPGGLCTPGLSAQVALQ